MMIPITLNVKESAYDKIIYFLSHFKDDVSIVHRANNNKNRDNNIYDDFFKTLRSRSIKIDKSVNIDNIMNEMNDGLS